MFAYRCIVLLHAECMLPDLSAASGSELPVLSAPRGVNLRAAISHAISQQQEAASSAASASLQQRLALGLRQQQQQQQVASSPGTPATLPCCLESAAATPLVPAVLPRSDDALPLPGKEQQQQPVLRATADLPASPGSDAAATSAASASVQASFGDSASWDWLLRGRFPGDSPAASGPVTLPLLPTVPGSTAAPGAGLAVAAAAATAEEEEKDKEKEGFPLERPRSVTQQYQADWEPSEVPPLQLPSTRPWTHDGTSSPVGLGPQRRPQQHHLSELDIEYRTRSAGLPPIWPLWAP